MLKLPNEYKFMSFFKVDGPHSNYSFANVFYRHNFDDRYLITKFYFYKYRPPFDSGEKSPPSIVPNPVKDTL